MTSSLEVSSCSGPLGHDALQSGRSEPNVLEEYTALIKNLYTKEVMMLTMSVLDILCGKFKIPQSVDFTEF